MSTGTYMTTGDNLRRREKTSVGRPSQVFVKGAVQKGSGERHS